MKKSEAFRAILTAGLVVGVLDISSAFVIWWQRGVGARRGLQGIAAGLLGPRSFQGGLATAALGLLCHFVSAFGAATVYFAMSRGMRFLVDHAVLSGVLYGVAVYFFMSRIVVPLSAARKYPFSFKMMVIGVVIHIFCVGLPIALSVRRYSIH